MVFVLNREMNKEKGRVAMEKKETTVRVPVNLIKELRERFPELRDESDSSTVRIALKKFLRTYP